jgi:hypothetical protein
MVTRRIVIEKAACKMRAYACMHRRIHTVHTACRASLVVQQIAELDVKERQKRNVRSRHLGDAGVHDAKLTASREECTEGRRMQYYCVL